MLLMRQVNMVPQSLGPKLVWGRVYSASIGRRSLGHAGESITRKRTCNKVLVQKYGGTNCDLAS